MTPTSAGNGLVVGVPREIKPDEHRVAITPDGVREVGQYGVQVLVEAGRGVRLELPRRGLPAGRRRDRRRGRGGVGAGRAHLQGEGAPAERVRLVPARPDHLHLPAPGRLPDRGRRAARPRRHRHRLRDGHRRRGRAPAAGADERGGRADVGPDRRALPRTPQRRPRRAARRRARRAPGARRRARRRQRRMERGVDGGRARGRGRPARPQRRPAALHRPDPDGTHHDAHVEPRSGRAGGRRGRPGHRRRARARRARARSW